MDHITFAIFKVKLLTRSGGNSDYAVNIMKRILITLFVSFVSGALLAQPIPQYKVDPTWPDIPLGDHWLTGGLGGLCIDSRDHIYLLNRQNVVVDDLDGARLAPPIIELNPQGAVVQGWGDPEQLGGRLHDCHVDASDGIWIVAAATGIIQKFSLDGSELLQQIGQSGQFDSSDGTRQGQPLNSDSAQFFLPGAVDVDSVNGDIYVADGELPGGNARIIVLTREGQFLRQWPLHRATDETEIAELPHCLRLSNDGMVYVCDRSADRIQVFSKQGTFIRNIDVGFVPLSSPVDRPSGARGTAVVLDFSRDPEQRYLYSINQNSVMVDIIDRQSGELVSSFGAGPGRYPGQFTLPHGIAVDSFGNVFIAEQEGRRIQKFILQNP